MLARHKQLVESYQRVQDFLTANPPTNPAPKYGEVRQELDDAIARLSSLLGDQSAGRRESLDDTRRQDILRRLLREKHLAPISRIAKAALGDDPVIRKALGMPNPKLPSMKLVTVAVGMRTSAAKYEPLFVESGRPANFLAQLDAAIETLRQSVLGRARSVGRHVGARAGLGQQLARARNVVRMLDAMVLDAFAGNAEVIARWNISKRVQDLPGAAVRATGGTADENLEVKSAAA